MGLPPSNLASWHWPGSGPVTAKGYRGGRGRELLALREVQDGLGGSGPQSHAMIRALVTGNAVWPGSTKGEYPTILLVRGTL